MGDEVESRLLSEEQILGFIAYPKHPVFHKYLSLFIGAFLSVISIYVQLPADLKDGFENVNANFLPFMSLPFILFTMLIENKKLFRDLCDVIRRAARATNTHLHDTQLELMANDAMNKMLFVRILMGFRLALIWFCIFNLFMMTMMYMVQQHWI